MYGGHFTISHQNLSFNSNSNVIDLQVRTQNCLKVSTSMNCDKNILGKEIHGCKMLKEIDANHPPSTKPILRSIKHGWCEITLYNIGHTFHVHRKRIWPLYILHISRAIPLTPPIGPTLQITQQLIIVIQIQQHKNVCSNWILRKPSWEVHQNKLRGASKQAERCIKTSWEVHQNKLRGASKQAERCIKTSWEVHQNKLRGASKQAERCIKTIKTMVKQTHNHRTSKRKQFHLGITVLQ